MSYDVQDPNHREEWRRAVLHDSTPVMVSVRGTDPDPTLDELEAEFGDHVRLVRLDADAVPPLLAHLHLDAFPGLLLLRRGEVFDRFVGRVPKRLLAARLRAMLDAA